MKDKNITKGDFESLVSHIQSTSNALQEDARLVINRNVTARAWLTGFYIVEYEQQGSDRAKYGEGLLKRLAERLDDKSFSLASLKNFRQFYLYYPELAEPVAKFLFTKFEKSQTLSDLFQTPKIQQDIKSQTLIGFFLETTDKQSGTNLEQTSMMRSQKQIAAVSSDGFAVQTKDGDVLPTPQMAFDRIPFSHYTLLIHIDNPLKRAFYAIEAMRGPWSFRELKRQIDSNYYERSGWSQKQELLASKVNEKAERPSFREELKSHYVFEFLGLTAKSVIEEDELEQALIDHLEEFMLELGMGFCCVATMKA